MQIWQGYLVVTKPLNHPFKFKAPNSNCRLSFQPTAEQKTEEVAAAKAAPEKEDAVDGKAEKEETKEAAKEGGDAAPAEPKEAAKEGGNAAPAEEKPAEEEKSS